MFPRYNPTFPMVYMRISQTKEGQHKYLPIREPGKHNARLDPPNRTQPTSDTRGSAKL